MDYEKLMKFGMSLAKAQVTFMNDEERLEISMLLRKLFQENLILRQDIQDMKLKVNK